MLQDGTILQNRYQIIQLLGQGGMGAVYLARDMRLGNNLVALKENRGGDARQFEQEAILLASLKHPNLPRVQDHFVVMNGQYVVGQYLVMEYIEGTDLDSQLQNGALPEAKVRAWFDQILDAVGYLHSRGVVHRDIKPANIRITPTGQAMLVDFGIAKVMQGGQKTLTGAKAVTPGFAAPEQHRGGTDARSDIYSLGATMYALLAGSVPPDAQSLERGSATLTKPRALNRAISANAEQVILQAMNVNPAARFSDAASMKQALHVSATLPPPRAGASSGNFPTRYAIFGGIGAAVLGVCVLGIILFNSFANQSNSTATTVPATRVARATFTSAPNATSTALPTNTQPPTPTAQPPTVLPPTIPPTVVPTNMPSTDTPTEIPAGNVVTGRALENLNIRAQPSTSAALLGKILKNTALTLFARTANSDWYQIVLPDNANARGWVAAQFVAVTSGEVSTLAEDSATNPAPTNVVAQQNQITDEIPGIKINLGESVSGRLDRESHPIDVYNFDLQRGQNFDFKVSAPNGCGSLFLFYPGARFVQDSAKRLDSYNCGDGQTGGFTVAESGTFYIAITAGGIGQPYSLTIRASGSGDSLPTSADEIPGIKINLGESVSGLLDRETHPIDVYNFALQRGQNFSFKVSAPNGCGSLFLFYPGARFVQDSAKRLDSYNCGDGQTGGFTVAESGTFYIAITAGGIGQPYSLTIRASGSGDSLPASADEIPGVKINLGESVSGLLDRETHPIDVYNFALQRGQNFSFKVSAPNGCGSLFLFYPGAKSVQDSAKRLDSYNCGDGQTGGFTVAESGTFYIAITAGGIGQPYTLTFRAPQ